MQFFPIMGMIVLCPLCQSKAMLGLMCNMWPPDVGFAAKLAAILEAGALYQLRRTEAAWSLLSKFRCSSSSAGGPGAAKSGILPTAALAKVSPCLHRLSTLKCCLKTCYFERKKKQHNVK